MDYNKKVQIVKTDKIGTKNKKENTMYIFENGAGNKDTILKTESEEPFRGKIWQIFSVVCGSLIEIPFGLMLGWPSPTYPYLLQPTSLVPISLDQSAMITGFLMIGNTISTPISSEFHFGPKYGLLISIGLMTIGWFFMWQANSVYWLLGSRIILGCGHGYGTGQLKNFVKEMCDENLAQLLTRQIMIYTNFAVVVAFILGNFLSFRTLSLVSIFISIFVMFLILLLPSTPKELVRSGKLKMAMQLLNYLRGHSDHFDELRQIEIDLHCYTKKRHSLFGALRKNPDLRKNFVIIIVLIFCQQFTGSPPFLIYTQIIFTESHCPYPEYCAFVYSLVFLFASVFGIFYSPKYNKKYVLILSSVSILMIVVINLLVLTFQINETFWSFTSLLVMSFFAIFHTIGLGCLPIALVGDLFPAEYRQKMTHICIMCLCMFALVSTKIFQAILGEYSLIICFYSILAMTVFTIVFIISFVPKSLKD